MLLIMELTTPYAFGAMRKEEADQALNKEAASAQRSNPFDRLPIAVIGHIQTFLHSNEVAIQTRKVDRAFLDASKAQSLSKCELIDASFCLPGCHLAEFDNEHRPCNLLEYAQQAFSSDYSCLPLKCFKHVIFKNCCTCLGCGPETLVKFFTTYGKNIKKLDISESWFTGNLHNPLNIIPLIATTCPNLEAFNISDTVLSAYDDKDFVRVNLELADLLKKCPKIKEFFFNGFWAKSIIFDAMAERNHSFVSVHCNKSFMVTKNAIIAFLKKHGATLEHLTLHRSSIKDLGDIAAYCPNLKSFTLG
jgi:hypothetical protein